MGKVVYAAAMSHVLYPDYYGKNVGAHGRRMVEELIAVVRDMGREMLAAKPDALVVIADDHNLGLFEQPGAPRPDERVARMYHSAWEVGDITDLVRARLRLAEAGALVGSSDHGVSLSLYAKDPDGLEFEIFWTVPGGASAGTRALDLEAEVARWSARSV